jgi:hypothetical protein
MKAVLVAILFAVAAFTQGCQSWSTRGGWSGFNSAGFSGGVGQPDNPKDSTTGEYVEIRPDGTRITWTTKIGAAQKNTIGEAVAKLSALRPVMFVGIGLFVLGAASLVWPPLKAIVGSATTSAVAMIAGLGLTILPSVVVGNELLILCVGIGAVALYWFSHRHGSARAEVKILREKM